MHLYRRLLREVWPHRAAFFAAILMLLIVALTEPLLPLLFDRLIEGAFGQSSQLVNAGQLKDWYGKLKDLLNHMPIVWIPVVVILAFLVRGVANFLGDFAINHVGQKVVLSLRSQLFAHVLKLPTATLDKTTTAQLTSKISYDIGNVAQAATQALTVIVQDTATLIFLLVLMWMVSPKLTLVALSIAPIVGIVVRLLSKRLRRTSTALQDAMGAMTGQSEQAIACHKMVKLFGGQMHEQSRFTTLANQVRRFTMKQAAATAAGVPLSHLFVSFAIAAVLWLAIDEAKAGALTAGGFMAFLIALTQLLTPLKRLTNINAVVQRGLAAAHTVYEVLDQKTEEDLGQETGKNTTGAIRFEKVNFRYPNQHQGDYALSQFNLDIKAGETIAFVGASGSGKTSLTQLLCRYQQAQSGTITLDGLPIANYALEHYRAQLAMVSQEVVLFNDTVANNIAYARPQATRDEIATAARAAHAEEFIVQLSEGYDTVIGERGGRLSGGQRQRLAIARALLKKAPVLILDEATSALDNASERAVQAAITELMGKQTTLIIAHRLSTIEHADRIVVMEKGRIVEVGRHQDLLQKSGAYAILHLSGETKS